MTDYTLTVSIDSNPALEGAKVYSRAEGIITTSAKKIEKETEQAGKNMGGMGTAAKKAGAGTGELSKKTEELAHKSADLSTATEKTTSSFSKYSAVIVGGALAGTAAFIAVMGAAATAAAQLDAKMREVSVLMDDDFGSSLEGATGLVREMAKEFNSTVFEQADALKKLVTSSDNAAQAQQRLTLANQLALTGATSLMEATDAVSAVQKQFKLSTEEMEGATNAMFLALREGGVELGAFAQQLDTIAPYATEAGVAFGDVVAVTTALAKNGIPASQAMMGIRDALIDLEGPGTAARDMARDLGIQFNTAAVEGAGGFVAFMEQVIEATGGSAYQIQQLFPSINAQTLAMGLAGEAGKDLSEVLKTLAEDTEALGKAQDEIADGPLFKLGEIGASFTDQLRGAGQGTLEKLTPLIDFFHKYKDTLADVAVTIGLVAGGLIALGTAGAAAGAALSIVGMGMVVLAPVLPALAAGFVVLASVMAVIDFLKFAEDTAFWATTVISLQETLLIFGENLDAFISRTKLAWELLTADSTNGLNLLAAGVLSYVSELEAIPESLRANAKAVADGLKKELTAYDKFQKKVDEVNKKRDDNIALIQKQAKEQRMAARSAAAEAKALRDSGDAAAEVGDEHEEAAGKLKTFTQRLEDMLGKLGRTPDEYKKLIRQLNPMIALTEDYTQKAELLGAALAVAGKDQIPLIIESIMRLRQEFVESKEAIEAMDPALQSLLDSLFPVEAVTRNYLEAQKELRDAYADNELGGYSLAKSLENLELQYNRQLVQARRSAAEAYPWGAAWEEAIKRVDRAFFNLWESAFDGFDSFIDAMESALKTFAAQTLHTIFTKPLVEGLSNAVAGAGFVTNDNNHGNTNPLSNIMALKNVFSYGKDVLAGFSSGGFSGAYSAATAPLSNLASGSLFGSGGSVANGLANIAPSSWTTQAYGGMAPGTPGGGITTINSINWGQIGIDLGMGFVGGYTGTKAGESLFNRQAESSLGATTLGAVGSYLLPGIGTLVGAFVGGMLDAAFGSSNSDKTAAFLTDFETGEQTYTGLTGDKKKQGNIDIVQNELIPVFQQFADIIGGSAAKLDIAFGSRDGLRLDGVDFGEETDDFFKAGFGKLLDEALVELNPALTQLIKSFKGTAQETMAFAGVMLETEEAIKNSSVPELTEAYEDAKDATRDLTGLYDEHSEAVIELARTFDGSLESAVQLNAAVKENQIIINEFALAILQAKDVVAAGIGGVLEAINEQTMSYEEAVYDQIQLAETLREEIRTLSDPEAIAGNVEQIIALWGNVFGSISQGLQGLLTLSQSIDAQLNSSIQNFERDTMSPNEVATSIEQEIQALTDALPTLTDPTAIEDHITRINTLTNELWNMLPDEDKITKLSEFTTFLSDINTVAQELITTLGEDLTAMVGVDGEGMDLEGMMQATQDQFVTMLTALDESTSTRFQEILDGLSERQRQIEEEYGTALAEGAGQIQQGGADIAAAAARMGITAEQLARALANINVNVDVSGLGDGALAP